MQPQQTNNPPTSQPFDSLDASIDGVINSAVASVSSQPLTQNTSYPSTTNSNYYISQTQSQMSNILDSNSHPSIISTPSLISTAPLELISLPMEMSNVPLGILAPPLGSLPMETPQTQPLDVSVLPLSDSLVNRQDIPFDDHLNYNCLLNFQALAAKIHASMPESEVVDYDVLIMISNVIFKIIKF